MSDPEYTIHIQICSDGVGYDVTDVVAGFACDLPTALNTCREHILADVQRKEAFLRGDAK